MSLLIASLADAAVLVTLALAATAVLRRRSAALRHAILATAIVAASLMPALESLLPQLPVVRWYDPVTVWSSGPTLTSGDAIAAAAIDETVTARELPWALLALSVWGIGVVVIGAGLITGMARLARLRARCTPVTGRWRELADELRGQCGVRRQVVLLQSDDPSLLVTCGVLTPTIIIPAGASQWSDDRTRVVLRHELAHIARHDAAVQVCGEALRALHWVNPLVWLACRRLRQESECACDDAVLSGGVEPADYATHLLDVARHLSGRHAAWPSAPAIAHPSTLERRIVVMLQHQQNRAPVNRRAWLAAALAALAISIPLAAAGVAPPERAVIQLSEGHDVLLGGAPAHAPNTGPRGVAGSRPFIAVPAPAAARVNATVAARQTTGTFAGSVLDQSGATMPGVQLTLTERQGGAELLAITDARGRFAFRDLQPADYTLESRLPGFATVSTVLTVSSGATVQRTITMPIGTLQETVTLACGATPALARLVLRSIGTSVFAVLSAQEPAATPVRVGGNVRPPRKIRDVKPICPQTAPSGETTVRLNARVGVDGFMIDVTPAPNDFPIEPPRELTDSAIDAIRQWQFTPTLLNGQPVEVTFKVEVIFRK